MNQYNEEFDGYLDDDPFENNNNDNNTNNNNNGNNNNNNGYAQSHIQLLDTSPSNMKRLIDAGYKTVDDFQNQTAVTLAKECNLTNKDALHIIRQVKMGVQSLRNQFFIKQQQKQQQQQSNISTTHNNNPTTTSSTTPTISTPTTNNNNNNTTTSTVRTKSAFESLQQHRDRKSIITFCKEVDDLLHGGIPMGRTSEICGVPGVGKTQLALQLAVNVQLPSAMDGCEGECLYIDTEGSFMTERLEQIAIAFVKHIHRMKNALVASLSSLSSTSSSGGDGGVGGDGETGEEDEELKKQREMIEKRIAAIEAMTVDGVMQRVRYYRLFNLLEQLAFVQILDSYVKQNNIKLIIFDSITFHFRHDQAGFGDTFQRSRLLQAMGQKMSQIANDNDIAVVYLNQVTTKIDKNDSSHSHLAPALGMTWSNACNNHFFLEFDRGERYFRINKSLHSEPSRAKFAITADGFRGVNRRTIAYEETQSTATDQSNEQSRKRQRE